jgi:hypothetical protein
MCCGEYLERPHGMMNAPLITEAMAKVRSETFPCTIRLSNTRAASLLWAACV